MLYGIILGIHVVICIALVLVVLLQSSKGGGLAGGSAFGGGAESTIFGGRGAATFLSKATTIFGVAFMVSSLTLTLMSAGGGTPTSVIAEEAARGPGAPQTSAPTAPPGAGTLPGEAPAGPALPPAEGTPAGTDAGAPDETPAAGTGEETGSGG
jgi:preprotein translocase subunit SecG